MSSGWVRRRRDGTFTIRLEARERELLRSLPAQLRPLLGSGEPSLRRLTPPAYVDDPEHEAEYQDLMAGELRERHARALEVLETTADADRLDEEQLGAWLRALNDLRLVLGTTLDVREDADHDDVPHDDPRYPALAVYGYLTALQSDIVDALSTSL